MTQVVAAGTGHNAAIAGYDVAGKTGTAQKLDPATRRYSRNPGVLSFVGFAPADEPRLAMLVMLDEPKNEKWGSEAAAPIFSAIGGEVLRYLDVPPRDAAPLAIVTGPPERPRRRARAARPAVERRRARKRRARHAGAARPDAAPGAGHARAARAWASRWTAAACVVVEQAPAPGDDAGRAEAGVRLTLASSAAR